MPPSLAGRSIVSSKSMGGTVSTVPPVPIRFRDQARYVFFIFYKTKRLDHGIGWGFSNTLYVRPESYEKSRFMRDFLFSDLLLRRKKGGMILPESAEDVPVAQWIERRPPKLEIEVRFLMGTYACRKISCRWHGIIDLLINYLPTAIPRFRPVGDSAESPTTLEKLFNIYTVYAS